jgi:hypothetical protein
MTLKSFSIAFALAGAKEAVNNMLQHVKHVVIGPSALQRELDPTARTDGNLSFMFYLSLLADVVAYLLWRTALG